MTVRLGFGKNVHGYLAAGDTIARGGSVIFAGVIEIADGVLDVLHYRPTLEEQKELLAWRLRIMLEARKRLALRSGGCC